MIRPGRVTALADKTVTVEIGRHSACGECDSVATCVSMNEKKSIVLTLPNPGNLTVGQTIGIEVSDGVVTGAVLLAYGLPLFFFFLGLTAVNLWNTNASDGKSALVAFGFGAFGFGLGALISRKKFLKKPYRIIPEGEHQLVAQRCPSSPSN